MQHSCPCGGLVAIIILLLIVEYFYNGLDGE
jgi:hypothetical protein